MELFAALTELESSDLVRRLDDSEPAYSIKHALVQDTAQESLLKNERKRLNLLVAQTLEKLYAERLDELAARLWQHYDAAGVDEKAMAYAERAGNAAVRISAYREAIAAYQRAFELAQARRDNSEVLIRLVTQWGRAHELAVDYDAAIALYQRTRELARTRADRALELAAMVQLAKVWAVAAVRYEPEQAQEIASEALVLARALKDERTEARVLWTMMLLNLYGAGGAKQGVQYGEQSLALARALNWREQMAFTLNDLFYTYLNLGEIARARAVLHEARALWRELDDKNMLTDNLSAGGMDHIVRGEFDAALAMAHESRALAQSIGNRWGECTSYMMEAYVHLARGAFDKTVDAFDACIAVGDPIGVQGPVLMAYYELAKLYAWFGDSTRGIVFAREALERTRRYTLGWDGWAYGTLAHVEIARGDWDAAERAMQEIHDAPPEYFFERMLPSGVVSIVQLQAAMEMRRGEWDAAERRVQQLLARLHASEFKIFLPTVLETYARVLMGKCEWETAHRALQEAQAIADAVEMLPACFEIAVARFDLETARGNSDAAVRAREQAERARNQLLPRVPHEWRASFLQTRLARRVNDDA